jgi:hypothetical protein
VRPGLDGTTAREIAILKSVMQSSIKVLLTGAVLCWPATVHAQTCQNLYDAIKRAAMYCGFDCDQQALEPLQQTYERQCIVAVIPMSVFPDDPRPEQPGPAAIRSGLMTQLTGEALEPEPAAP